MLGCTYTYKNIYILSKRYTEPSVYEKKIFECYDGVRPPVGFISPHPPSGGFLI